MTESRLHGFAIVMLLVGAAANGLYGLVGLMEDDHFVPDDLIVVAGINAVAQMMAIGAYPLWSVTVLAVDVLTIYALAVHSPREPA